MIFEVVVSITTVCEQTNYRNALTRDIQFLFSPDGSYWHRIESFNFIICIWFTLSKENNGETLNKSQLSY